MPKLSGRLADHPAFREQYVMAMWMLPFCVGLLILCAWNIGDVDWILQGYAVVVSILLCAASLGKIGTYHLTWAIRDEGLGENRWGSVCRSIPITQVQFCTEVALQCYFGSHYGQYLATYYVLSDRPIPYFWHISGPGFGALWHFWKRGLILVPATEEVRACLEGHGISRIPQYPRVGCLIKGERP